MKHLSQLALGVALCAVVTSAISFGAAFTGGLVANGGGVVEPTTGNFVTVGFEAEEQADGSITGEGVLQNHTTGITISYELNETLTVGGATYLAGPVTGGNGPPVGFLAIFAIEDGGQPNAGADLHSNFFAVPSVQFPDIHAVVGSPNSAFPGGFPPFFFFPLVKGNVTVH
ncbi:MAG: hypothetical protein ACJA2W_001594 [Planctomycetota bacterium]|jgi:hypothetical protein